MMFKNRHSKSQQRYFRKQYKINMQIKGKPAYKLIWANTPEQAVRMLGDYWKDYINSVEQVTD